MKVLEGESQQTLNTQLRLFHERALPDLDRNIKCGNSLIDSRFYEVQQLLLFDEETQYRVNAFDWERAFPTVFSGTDPGFDAVIGVSVAIGALQQNNALHEVLRSIDYQVRRQQPQVQASMPPSNLWMPAAYPGMPPTNL